MSLRIGCFLIIFLFLFPNSAFADPISIPSKDAGWLETLNYYRQSSGVEPVRENLVQSEAALKHSIYLAKSDPKYFHGKYENPHTENPESPYYTKEGAGSGTNLTSEGRESDAIDSWMQAPLHAIGLLRDNLKTTGYASVLNDRTGTFHTGLDVINGLVGSKGKVITFPGNGSFVRLNKFVGEAPDPRESCGTNWKEFRGLPIFASFLNSPPRDITGTIRTPEGKLLSQGADLCIVTEFSWASTDKVISYGNQIMAGDHLVIVIARLPFNPGEHSVTLSGTGVTSLSWKFTVIPPVPKTAPIFDIDKQLITWDRVVMPASNAILGYTLLALNRNTNLTKEYRTQDLELTTKNWSAGEYFICVKARSLNDESECDWKYARVFEKLPTVKFIFNSSLEEITWDEIDFGDSVRKIEYVIRTRNRITDKSADFKVSERRYSTANWDQGGYWICVQAIAPGAESDCSTYYGYEIDRKPKSIQFELRSLNPAKVSWDIKSSLETTARPTSALIRLRTLKSSDLIKSEQIDPSSGEWLIPSLPVGDYEICLEASNINGKTECFWKSFKIREKEIPEFILDSKSIRVGESVLIRSMSNVAVQYGNASASVCEMKLVDAGLSLRGLKVGKCSIQITSTQDEFFLASTSQFSISVIKQSSSSVKNTTAKCVKGKEVRFVSGIRPSCPAGFKKVG